MKVLVAAIGNPDRGDDGAGPAVAARLRGRVPETARIVVCGGDVLALIEEWRGFPDVIVVDAAAPLGRPGRIHRTWLFPRVAGEVASAASRRGRRADGPLHHAAHGPPPPLPAGEEPLARASSHALGLAETVELARGLGRLPRRLVAYLVEGDCFDFGAPLSPAVAAAVDIVAARILAELRRIAAPQAEF